MGQGVVQPQAGVALIRSLTVDRYSKDVLAPGWQKAHLKQTRDVPVGPDLAGGVGDFCGAGGRWGITPAGSAGGGGGMRKAPTEHLI